MNKEITIFCNICSKKKKLSDRVDCIWLITWLSVLPKEENEPNDPYNTLEINFLVCSQLLVFSLVKCEPKANKKEQSVIACPRAKASAKLESDSFVVALVQSLGILVKAFSSLTFGACSYVQFNQVWKIALEEIDRPIKP